MKELEKIINYLIKEKGGTKEQYLDLLKKIGYHESAHTMDPTIKQIGGGPGRGIYQFEEGQNAGGITAARRTKQYLDSVGASIPKWLKEATSSDSLDATKLSTEQQGILFLGNMRKHPKADLGKLVNGEESIEDFWANYHWAGDPLDRKNRINSFKESISNLPEKKTYTEPLPPARITPSEGHITNPAREYINPLSIPKQYKIANKPIEGPSQMNLDPIRANIGSFEGLIKQINQKALGGTSNTYYEGGYINSIDPDPTDPKKPLNKSDIKNIQKSTGIMFNNEGVNQLFERNNKFVKPNYADNLNLGKYKGLDYFDITKDSTGYILNPTKKNIRGPEAHRDTLLELQKLNPNIIINQRAYTPMSNRMAYGGLENSNCGGPGQPPCPDLKVTSKDDPRYQAYQDSLALYNNYKKVTKELLDAGYNYKPPTGRYAKTQKQAFKSYESHKKANEAQGNFRNESSTLKSTRDFMPGEKDSNGKYWFQNPNISRQLYSDEIEPTGSKVYSYKDGKGIEQFTTFFGGVNLDKVAKYRKETGDWKTGDIRVVASYDNVKPKQKVIVKEEDNLPNQFKKTISDIPKSKVRPRETSIGLDSKEVVFTNPSIEIKPLQLRKQLETLPYNISTHRTMTDEDGNRYGIHNKEVKRIQSRGEYRKNNLRPNGNEYAYGGTSDNNQYKYGGLNSFNVGGLHSQNPYGGIPQGIGSNGKRNTVEEGETSMYIKDIGKFIFSNRINIDGSGYNPKALGYANGGSMSGCGGPGQPPCRKRKDERY